MGSKVEARLPSAAYALLLTVVVISNENPVYPGYIVLLAVYPFTKKQAAG
jgi:hypothetical protein